ncbi:MAG: hypothetical protein MJB57_04750 [Gemmatimonadetes bacterium]|nr:hypothetical protein [Gemmatimonadota bacterium]
MEADLEKLPRTRYMSKRLSEQRSDKEAIAVVIADKFIGDKNSVLLDAGSTGEKVADELFRRREHLSVLTNNLGAYASYVRAGLLERSGAQPGSDNGGPPSRPSGNELLLTGGRYDDTYESLLGKNTEASIRAFAPNVTVIGVSGLKHDEGVFCHGADEASVKELLWTTKTDKRIIAADWTKIGSRDAHPFGGVEKMNFSANQAIVVTTTPPAEVTADREHEFEVEVDKLQGFGIQVVLANEVLSAGSGG